MLKKLAFLSLVVSLFFSFSLGVQAFSFDRNLYYGLVADSDVKELQKILAQEQCFDFPDYTGNFYSLTSKGVKCFQAKHGIDATGYVGPLTRAKLNELYGSQKPEEKPSVPQTPSSLENQNIPGDLTVGGNIKSSRLYSENKDLVINTLGTGNIIVNAREGLTLTGRIITLDAKVPTNVPGIGSATIHIQDPLYIKSTISQSGGGQATFSGNIDAENGLDVTGANLTVGGSNFTVNPTNGDITTAGSLTISGNQNISGNATIGGTLGVTATTTLDSNLVMANGKWAGLGSGKGRMVFTDAATDVLGVQNANLDLNTNVITNIGNSGTDFTSSGGLTLAGDLAVNGGDITSSGALTITPNGGSNLNIALSGEGDFAVNTNDLYVDTSSGYVGVASTTPATNFSVSGNAYATGGLGVGVLNSVAGTLQTSGQATVGGNCQVNGNTILGDASTDTITFTAKSASNLDMNNNLLLNIGAAGTDFTSGGGLTLAGALTATTTQLTVNTGSAALTVQQSGTGNILDLKDASASQLVVDNTGKLVFGGDTNLYRSAANVLKTDDSLMIAANATTTGNFDVVGQTRLGGGSQITKVLFGQVTVDPPSIAAEDTATVDVAVSGITADSKIFVTPPAGWATGANRWAIFDGANASSTAGYIRFSFFNASTTGAVDPAASTWSWMAVK